MERVNYRYRLRVTLTFGNEPKEDRERRTTEVIETLKHLGWRVESRPLGARIDYNRDDSEDISNIEMLFDCTDDDRPTIPGNLDFKSLKLWAEPLGDR